MTTALSLMQRERLRSIGNRGVQPGGASTYLPLELIPGQPYEETLRLDGLGFAPEPAEWTVLFMGPTGEVLAAQPTVSQEDQLRVEVDTATNAQLFVACRRGRDVGEWMIAPGPLATGPILWKKPDREWRDLNWLDLGPSGEQTKEAVITLKGTERGDFVDGVAYVEGDIVTVQGRQFYCIADTFGAPGSGPNLDPSDPATNTIIPQAYPYDTVTATEATTPAAAAPAGAAAE